jgi:protein-S-isoprenylcysteine O-methyltransferase
LLFICNNIDIFARETRTKRFLFEEENLDPKQLKRIYMKNIDFFQLTSYCWLLLMVYWLLAGMHTKITVKKEASGIRLVYLALMFAAFALVYFSRLHIGFLGMKFISPNIYTPWIGLVLHLCGIGLAMAARWKLGENWSGTVTVKKDHELIQTGPYALTRHPIYTGIFFGLLGAVVIQGETRGLIALVILFLALHIKIAKEETFMKQLFPSYTRYVRSTKKFIPLIY